MRIYEHFNEIEFLAGDTIEIIIKVNRKNEDGSKEPYNTTGNTMKCLVARIGNEKEPMAEIECAAIEGGFRCEIQSNETKGWSGRYAVHFKMEENGTAYRRTYGYFDVIPVPEG